MDDHRIGTNSPYVRVGIWADAYSTVRGSFHFVFNVPVDTMPANLDRETGWFYGEWIYAR